MKHIVQYTVHERKRRHKESYALLTQDKVKSGDTGKGCTRSEMLMETCLNVPYEQQEQGKTADYKCYAEKNLQDLARRC